MFGDCQLKFGRKKLEAKVTLTVKAGSLFSQRLSKRWLGQLGTFKCRHD